MFSTCSISPEILFLQFLHLFMDISAVSHSLCGVVSEIICVSWYFFVTMLLVWELPF